MKSGLDAMEEIQIFPERKSLHLIDGQTTAEIGHALGDFQNRRVGDDELQIRVAVVDLLHLY